MSREGEPPWVDELDQANAEGLRVFARTYVAMAASAPWPRRRARSRLVWAVPVVAALLAGLALLGALGPEAVPWRPPIPTLSSPRAESTPPRAALPSIIDASPARPKAALRIGETGDFAVVARGTGLRYGWTLDGRPMGTGPRWVWAPARGESGHRRVEVTVTGPDGAERRSWVVRVRPPRPPSIMTAEPARGTLRVDAGTALRLRVDARPGTPAERLDTAWTVDGKPAGNGNAVVVHADRPGAMTVRALVASDLGATTTREWQVTVAEPEPAPELVASPEPRLASVTPPPPPPSLSRALTRVAPPPRPEAPSARDDDVRRWLDRYATAWRMRDVDTLRRMGQVTTEEEIAGLRRYFDTVRDLDVELNLLAIYSQAGHTVVRFTRRDRFRDPAGRLVLKESPPIEKAIVRTSDGFRIERPRG